MPQLGHGFAHHLALLVALLNDFGIFWNALAVLISVATIAATTAATDAATTAEAATALATLPSVATLSRPGRFARYRAAALSLALRTTALTRSAGAAHLAPELLHLKVVLIVQALDLQPSACL